MSAAHPLLFLGLFWILVHALHRRHTGSSSNHPNTLLPVTTLNHHDRHKTPSMRISLSRLSLRAEYFGLNRAHDRFSSMVASSPHSVTSRILVLFYDLGSLLAVSGMLLAVFFLASTTAKFCYSATLAFSTSGEPQSSPVHTKRDLDIRAEVSNDVSVSSFDTQDTYIQLLIPGVSVPLWHTFPLLSALFICQVFHEAGHAIAAALNSVPLLSVGAAFTVAIPAAFVSLSSTTMQTLSARARLRIISAGTTHNLSLWMFLAALSSMAISPFLWSILGYVDVGHYARVISAVDADSPLRPHMPIGALITHLNDEPLASVTEDAWSQFLSANTAPHQHQDLGWCAEQAWFEAQSDECCISHKPETGLSCFKAPASPRFRSLEKCLAPHAFLNGASSATAQRCQDAIDCETTHVCVRPRADEEILRIKLLIPEQLSTDKKEREETVIWSGPRKEVLHDVAVGAFAPQYAFLPLIIPIIVNTLFRYISTLTLSLFFFNLLPLPSLDGGQFLGALLDLVLQYMRPPRGPEIELAELEAGESYTHASIQSPSMLKWKRVTMKVAGIGVAGMLGICGISALVTPFVRS